MGILGFLAGAAGKAVVKHVAKDAALLAGASAAQKIYDDTCDRQEEELKKEIKESKGHSSDNNDFVMTLPTDKNQVDTNSQKEYSGPDYGAEVDDSGGGVGIGVPGPAGIGVAGAAAVVGKVVTAPVKVVAAPAYIIRDTIHKPDLEEAAKQGIPVLNETKDEHYINSSEQMSDHSDSNEVFHLPSYNVKK